jgi:hypothetical protein
MKETTEYSYAGNVVEPNHGTTFYTYTDVPKTTAKETTEYSYAGNAAKSDQGATFYTYTDMPRTTAKETTEYSYAGNAGMVGIAEMSRFNYFGADD